VVSITAQGRGWPEAVEAVAHERAETYTESYLAALIVLARLAIAVGDPGFEQHQLAPFSAVRKGMICLLRPGELDSE